MKKNNQIKIFNYFEKKSSYYENIKNSILFLLIKKKELDIFIKNVNIFKKDRVIDLASGSGFYINEILKYEPKEIYAIDFSLNMLEKIKISKVIKIHSSIENLILDKIFDKVFCFGLLEFCKDIDIIFKKIYNLSDSNTQIFIIFPRKNIFGFFYKFYHFLNGFNIELRNFTEIENKLFKNNFMIIKKYNTLLSTFVVINKND